MGIGMYGCGACLRPMLGTDMAEHLTLSISGFDGKSVPNQFLKQDGRATGLAILLPGLGYTCDMPLFYYSELQFLVGGYDVLRVDYDYRHLRSTSSGLENIAERLFADVGAAMRLATQQRRYPAIAIVGKSLGTLAMAHLVGTGELSGDTTSVWMTPLLKEDVVFDALMNVAGPTGVVIGTEDHHYDDERLASLEARDNVTLITVAGGNHSLNAGKSAGESAQTLAGTIGQLDTFYDFADRHDGEMD